MQMQEIDTIRRAKRCSVTELCRRAGVSRSGYYATLNGGKSFSPATQAKLADEVAKYEP